MSKYDSLDNLIHKIYKFLKMNDQKFIKQLILKNKPETLKETLTKISEIILNSVNALNLKRDENRQDFIVDKMMDYLKNNYPDILNSEISVVDIGGGNGNVISTINTKVNGNKNNFVCVETKNEWVESYPCDNDNILYKYWNNDVIDIPNESCNLVLCMVSLHHMKGETINNVINEIKRILKNGGILMIKEHDAETITTYNLIEWEHHLYHILDCAYNKKMVDADEYMKHSINNFNDKSYWHIMLEKTHGFELKDRTNRFLDGPYKNRDYKNPTNLYWEIYEKK